MLKKIFATIIIFSILLTGCYDQREIDDFAYVIAIGIDSSNEIGKYKFTLCFANPYVIAEAKEKTSGNTSNITIDATDVFSAIDLINNNVSKKINLAHTKLIVFSTNTAISGIENFTDSFMRELKIRPATIIAVSKNSQEYLNNLEPTLEINPEKYFKEIFENDNTNFISKATLSDVFYSTNGGGKNITLPVVGITGEKQENDESKETFNDNSEKNKDLSLSTLKVKNQAMIVGTAAFDRGKLINISSPYENLYHSLIIGKAKKSAYNIPLENGEMVVSINQLTKPKICVKCNEIPKIYVDITIDCEIISLPDSMKESTQIDMVANIVEDDLKKNILSYLNNSSTYLCTDTENFFKYAKRRFLTVKKWQEYNWKEKYKNADFQVNVLADVTKFGVLKNN